MTKDSLSLPVADLSAFARALARQFPADSPAPPHLSLMNMLARATGFRNLQHLRASQRAEAREVPPPPIADHTLVERALAQFDAEGQLRQWPARRSVQILCLWALWAQLPRGAAQSEREISATLNRLHRFGDAAILRRDMVALGLLARKADASDYRRIEQPPPPEARALIARLGPRRAPAA